MAIRYRKGRASPWQCYWNNPLTGKRECANFATRHEAEKHDSLIKHRLRFDRESFQRETEEENEKAERGLTLEACYFEYLRQKKFSKKNLACHVSAMRYILKRLGTSPVGEITRKEIEHLLEEMQGASVKNVTVRGRLAVLRTVLRWSAERGFRGPVDFPRLPTAHYERFIPPTPEEVRSILVCAAPHIVRVVILGSQMGVRVGASELLQLTWNDVELERKILRISGANKNPGAPWREVPIRDSLIPIFETWYSEDAREGIAYLIHYKGKQISSIKTAWHKTLVRAGITRRIRPYDLRHAFATELIAGGADIGTVSKLMGHSTPTMLLTHYQYVMDRQKREAINALPDIGYVPMHMCPKEKALTQNE